MDERESIDPSALYTLKEARQYLRISDATARRWIKEGRLRARKIGRDYRVRGDEISAETSSFDWSKVKVLTPDSRFFELAGVGDSGYTDISRNKKEHLADVYYEESHPEDKE
jgi:excisionase family DNA binding protein